MLTPRREFTISVSGSHASELSIAVPPSGGTAELRWKRFLLRASGSDERPVGPVELS